jgi:hypothetical protein
VGVGIDDWKSISHFDFSLHAARRRVLSNGNAIVGALSSRISAHVTDLPPTHMSLTQSADFFLSLLFYYYGEQMMHRRFCTDSDSPRWLVVGGERNRGLKKSRPWPEKSIRCNNLCFTIARCLVPI